jgi:integrase
LRMLFYAAMDEYNDEEREEIRIRHNPFRKHKIGKAPESEKRVLSVDEIRKIRDVKDEQLILKRSVLARDVFMLSFYLAGTNLIDLYHLKKEDFKDKRISYQRHKTQDKRKDKAFISILAQPEAMKLMKKYLDPDGEYLFTFPKMYADHLNFVKAVDKGLKHVAKVCEIESKVSTYYARFSLASIARNDCGISKDDINLLLNHVDLNLRITDIYIKKDWSIIDKVIRRVIDYLNMEMTSIVN